MKKQIQELEVIVEPQDLLKDKMSLIKGGAASGIKCKPTGTITCSTGAVTARNDISVW